MRRACSDTAPSNVHEKDGAGTVPESEDAAKSWRRLTVRRGPTLAWSEGRPWSRCTVRHPRRPRPLASTPRRGLSLAAAVCAIALLALLVALTATAPAAAAAAAAALAAAPASTTTGRRRGGLSPRLRRRRQPDRGPRQRRRAARDRLPAAHRPGPRLGGHRGAAARTGLRGPAGSAAATGRRSVRDRRRAGRFEQPGRRLGRGGGRRPAGRAGRTAVAGRRPQARRRNGRRRARRRRRGWRRRPSSGLVATVQTATAPAAFAAGSVAVSIIFPQSTSAGRRAHRELGDPRPRPRVRPARPRLSESHAAPGLHRRRGLKDPALVGSRRPGRRASDLRHPAGRQGRGRRKQVAVGSRAHRTSPRPTTRVAPPDHGRARLTRRRAPPTRRRPSAPTTTPCARPTAPTGPSPCTASTASTRAAASFPTAPSPTSSTCSGPTRSRPGTTTIYSPRLYDGVLAHEIGHIFGALDEYAPPTRGYPSTGNLYSGYLWVQNGNAVAGRHDQRRLHHAGRRRGHRRLRRRAVRRTGGHVRRHLPVDRAARSAGATRTRNGIPDVVDTTPTVTLQPADARRRRRRRSPAIARENPCPPGHNAKGRAFAKRHQHAACRTTCATASTAAPGRRWARPGTSATAELRLHDDRAHAVPLRGAPTRHVVTRRRPRPATTAPSSVVAWAAPTPVTLTLARGRGHHRPGRQGQADGAAPPTRTRFVPDRLSAGRRRRAARRRRDDAEDGHDRRRRDAPRSPSRPGSRRRSRPSLRPGAQSRSSRRRRRCTVTVAVRALLTARAGAAVGGARRRA